MTEHQKDAARRWAGQNERLRAAERAAGRPEGEVRLLAVGKTFPVEDLLACTEAGARAFGENYAQEGCAKVDWFREHHPELALEWHFIGPLQANKTRSVAERFDWVETIDRMRIAQRLSAQRPEGLEPLKVLVEVNVDGEATKSGVAPEEALVLAEAVRSLPRLALRGLMAIPAPAATPEAARASLARARAAFDAIRTSHPEWEDFNVLSMGMSADLESAVAEGSTEVRIGSAIFGARRYAAKA